METLLYVLGLLPSIATAMVVFYMQRRQNARDKEIEASRAARQREYELEVSLDIAVRDMAYMTALYVRDGKTNGELDGVMEAYQRAKRDWKEFMYSQGHEHLIKE